MSNTEKIGAVLVVGGGIGGIQASLDLADSGYKVYMVESKTAIGGHMAQLDKTFPTNDCAMCTISPRLVAAGLHHNIEIITNAELEELTGEAGNFEAVVNRRANFVDYEKCTGCGLCSEECPISIPDEYNQCLDKRKAIYKLYPQAVPNKFAISKLGNAPCSDGCPIRCDPSGYVSLAAQGRYKEAYSLVTERNPLPGICGRICDHPCETSCSRTLVDEPLSIAYIKRFLSDWNVENGERISAEEKQKDIVENGKKVAVIGAGPAGLTAALVLRKIGYSPTIFEAHGKAGGMLTLGIPEYRLPANIIEQEIQDILDYGIELKTNSPITDIDKLFDEGFEAVFLGVGSHKGRSMGLPGSDFENVSNGLEFLRKIRLGEKTSVKKRVLVVGGGNVALDCARSALRLGAESVTIVYRRSYESMPAYQHEIDWAEEEGIKIMTAKAPQKICDRDGVFSGLETLDVAKTSFSREKREIETVANSESTIEADELVIAIGQEPDLEFLGDNSQIDLESRGTLQISQATFMTTRKGVFAGGDVTRGAAGVIDAMADGRQAALAMDAYIRGEEFVPEGSNQPEIELTREDIKARREEERPRNVMPQLNLGERTASFEEVDIGFDEEAVKREAERCLYCSICSNCRRCETVCDANALVYDDTPKKETIKIGAVILAPGFHLYNSAKSGEYGYRRFPNVLSSLDYERLLSSSGPTLGHVQRISDKQEPKKIAFIQCVGSRNQENPYCSSVCCTHAIKQSMVTRDHSKNTRCKIFAMDIRAFGKGFDEYFERAKNEYEVEIIYTRPSSIRQDFKTKNLFLQYCTDGKNWTEEEFDMVILSAGLCQDDRAQMIVKACKITLNPYSFAESLAFASPSSSRTGVFLAGAFEEPKDIPETVTQASAAAAQAMELLADVRGSDVIEKIYPEEQDVSQEEPRIGVFVCHCGSNIEGVIDCEKTAEYAKGLKNVVYADHLLYSCSPDGLQNIKDTVAEQNLNRVVVASCTPRTHEPLFQETIREVGLNPYLFEMANIRDQCTWVHANLAEAAEDKAADLVRMAVGRARTIEPLTSQTYVPNREVLVIGGGVSGMTAALSVADQGFNVYLVEQSDTLGGETRKVFWTIEGENPHNHIEQLIAQVVGSKNITLFLDSEIVDTSGFVGNFESTIKSRGSRKEASVEHGATIVAIGAREMIPEEYDYGSCDRIVTQHSLEEQIIGNPDQIKQAKEIVMIQCVGSREPGRMVCSRVCCTEAVKNALAIKKLNPDASISILYRDIRTYGFREEYYTKAREMGVTFFRFDIDSKPEVVTTADGKVRVMMKDLNSGIDMEFDPDILALSAGIVPGPDNAKLATTFKVPVNLEGFCLEAHMKLRPVDFASDGIFLCGTCHAPKFIRECITQAKATAARAVSIISSPTMNISCVVSKVDADKCAACLTCVRTCPYDVPKINDNNVAEIEPAICHGCGVCAAACPAKAIDLMHYRDKQVIAKTNALYAEEREKVHSE